jgi:hypothetical protein
VPAAFELSVRRPLPGRRLEKKLVVFLKSCCAANAAAWATICFTASGQESRLVDILGWS